MIEYRHNAEILSNDSFVVPSGRPGFRRALLINPPVYDAQYWARWSQPAGLLRVATLLRSKGYNIDYIDCMETDAKGHVPKSWRKLGGRPLLWTRDNISKRIWHFGLKWEQFDSRLRALDEPPDEVWITSIMTYWWESTRDAIAHVRRVFP